MDNNENVNQLIQDQPIKKNDLSYLFEVPRSDDNDMDTSDLLSTKGLEENVSDLVSVSNDDVMGNQSEEVEEADINEMPGVPADYNELEQKRVQITPKGTSNIRRVDMPTTLGGINK